MTSQSSLLQSLISINFSLIAVTDVVVVALKGQQQTNKQTLTNYLYSVLFAIKQHNYGKVKTKRINHVILIAKMCISMYKKKN